MLKNLLTTVAVIATLLVTSASAREVQVMVPVICDHHATILEDAEKLFGITELVFMGAITGKDKSKMHYETWTDTAEKRWVSLMVSTSTIPDSTGGMMEVTIACVMGTGDEHIMRLPVNGNPA